MPGEFPEFGLDREFSRVVVPLAAADEHLQAFIGVNVFGDEYRGTLPPGQLELVDGFTWAEMKKAVRQGYGLSSRDFGLAVKLCMDTIAGETGFVVEQIPETESPGA